MKINLEYPYSQDWKFGYLVTNPEGRQTVILFNSSIDRSSTAYARYLMAVKEGRYLTEDEEVDHINTDHSDDCIDNLQILSVSEHKEKTNLEQSGQTYKSFICVGCGVKFIRSLQRVSKHTKYCSNACKYKNCKPPSNNTVDYQEVQRLIDDGMNDSQVASILSISSNTVLNYRQKNNIKSSKFNKSKLLEDNIDEIKNLLESGVKKVDIMNKYDVSKNTLSRFLKRNNM